jgi:hypothetical protein
MTLLEPAEAMEEQHKPRDLRSRERNDLRDRLLACDAPQLAEAYEAAVDLLDRSDFPARRHLLSHLVREIAEGLPEVVTGDKILRVNTTKALDELAPAWSREMPAPSPFEPAETPPAATIAVPAKLAAQVSRLAADHERVASNRRDKFALLMEALRPVRRRCGRRWNRSSVGGSKSCAGSRDTPTCHATRRPCPPTTPKRNGKPRRSCSGSSATSRTACAASWPATST